MLILGAAVAVVGGAGYLLYNRPPARKPRGPSGAAAGSGSEGESGTNGAGGSKKNKKKKSKKAGGGAKDGFLKGEGDDGPLLEEIAPKEKVQEKKDTVPEHLEGMFAFFRLLGVTFIFGG